MASDKKESHMGVESDMSIYVDGKKMENMEEALIEYQKDVEDFIESAGKAFDNAMSKAKDENDENAAEKEFESSVTEFLDNHVIVLSDKNNVFDRNNKFPQIEDFYTSYTYGGKYKQFSVEYEVVFAPNADGKVKDSLTLDNVNAAIGSSSDGDDSAAGVVFRGFAEVNVTNSATAGEFEAGDISEKFHKDDKMLKSESNSLNGKITVDDGATVAEIENYKTVLVSGENTKVTSISADVYEYEYDDEADDGEDTGHLISAVRKVDGSVTVEDGARVEKSISGYKNVTVNNASVGDVSGKSDNLSFEKIMTEETEDAEAEWTGKYEVDDTGEWEWEWASKITVSNNLDIKSNKGSNKVVSEFKSEGAAKFTDSTVGNVSNFTTVTVDGGYLYGISLAQHFNTTQTDTLKKDGDIVYTQTIAEKSTTAGSLSVSDADVAYSISGYNKVVITDASVGEEIRNNVSISGKTENVYIGDKAKDAMNGNEELEAASSSFVFSGTITGSVSVSVNNRDAYTGNIYNYANVKLKGTGRARVTAGDITGNANMRYKTYTVTDVKERDAINGSYDEYSKTSAVGNLNMTDAEANKVSGFKTVSLKNSRISSANRNINYEYMEEPFNTNSIITDDIDTTTDKKGAVTVEAKYFDSYTTVGSFTAVDSRVYGDINDFNTVKLTNTGAGNVTGSLEITKRDNSITVYEDYKYDPDENEEGEYGDIIFAEEETFKATAVTGSVSVKLDKNADAADFVGNANDDGKVSFRVGRISNYANVTLSGTDRLTLTAGNITGGTNTIEDSYSYVARDASSIDYKKEEKTRETAVGSLKMTDAKAGTVSGFKTVSLKNSSISSARSVLNTETEGYDEDGEWIGNIEKTTDKDGAVTVKEDSYSASAAVGSFTAVDSRGNGDITYFNTVKLTNTGAGSITGSLKFSGSSSDVKIYEDYKYKPEEGGEGEYGKLLSHESMSKSTSSVTGSVSVKLDKNADAAAGIVGNADDDDSALFSVGRISNYANVTLSGTDRLTLTAGNITGGTNTIKDSYSYVARDASSIDYKKEEKTRKTAVGSLKMTDAKAYTVSGFKTVSLKNSSISSARSVLNTEGFEEDGEWIGNIEKTTDKKGVVTVKEDSYIASAAVGSFTAVDSKVNGNITDFNTVKLTNTGADNITGSLKFSGSRSSVETYDSYSYDWNDGVEKWGKLNTNDVKGKFTTTVTGSVSVKLTKDANDNISVGNISDYAKVTISGISTGKGDEASVFRVTTGAICGGVNSVVQVVSDCVANGTLDNGDVINEINGTTETKYTNTITGSLKLTYADIDSDSDYAVKDYKTVNMKESTVQGDIYLSSSYSSVVNKGVSTKSVKEKNHNEITEIEEENSQSKAGGSFTAVESVIDGNISGYKTVKLTNTSAYDISASMDTISESKSTRMFYWENYDVDGTDYESGEPEEYSFNGVYEAKAAGSLTVKLDKNAEADVKIGSVSGFANVTLTGSEEYSVDVDNIIGGNIKYEYSYDTAHDEYIEGFDEPIRFVAGTLKMSYASAYDVNGFKKFTVNAGINRINSYEGFAAVDDKKNNNAETLTIAKKAVLIVEEGINLQGEDKLAVNGELIFWNDKFTKEEKDKDGNEIDVDYAVIDGGIKDVSGKGTIYVSDEAAGKLKLRDVNIVNLGETAVYFAGSAAELADNEEAVEYNGFGGGWLGDVDDFTDTVDKIILVVEEGVKFEYDTEKIELTLDGREYEDFSLGAGTYEVEFKLKDGVKESVNYIITEY